MIKVNAVALEAPKKDTAFTIVPVRGSVDDSTLLYAEAARVVTNALQTKGLHAAPSVEQADFIVDLDYGMAAPRSLGHVVVEPTELPKPVRAGVPTETDITNLRSSARGPIEKHLVLTAREVKKVGDDEPPRTLWKVELSTVDLSNDMRRYLPLLATAALDQIGQDTGGDQLIRVDENDKSMKLVKRPD